MSGIAKNLRVINSNTEIAKKVNLALLSVQLKFLNFSAKIEIRDTSKKENTTVIAIKTMGWKSQSPTCSWISGNEVMKSVFAGVFNPLKESD